MYARLSMFALLALAVVAAGCKVPAGRSGLPVSHNLPPTPMLMEPGPGVGGPGPGVLGPMGPARGGMGMMQGAGPAMGAAGGTVQVLFNDPERMQVQWDVSSVGAYDSKPLVVPGRQNFNQGGIYRLKLTSIKGREGVELYPTLEIGTVTPRTAAYLAHSAIPVQFTTEDFDQVMAGNFVTKVIYVPDPDFQELALAGVETLVSTRLDPGVDPIVEADRRGAILGIIRMGNKDMEVPGGGADAAQIGMMYRGGGGGGEGFAPSGYISGVTGPQYGKPYVGTNIGLPGPPHVPLGGPAGLRQHNIRNYTATAIPGPTKRVNVHVKQRPGLSYPRPADNVFIREHTIRSPHFNSQPPTDMVHGPISCQSCGGRGCNRCR